MPADCGGLAEPSFEEIYARAGDDLASVPWARLAPHPDLVAWLDSQPDGLHSLAGERALVVACGLGDDAEELARRGYRVTGFDGSPTAIAHCLERFPSSPVDYHVADLFTLPGWWGSRSALVVEIRTIQSLPLGQRARGIAAIAGLVAPGGLLFVHCLARDEDEPAGTRPWPVRRSDLDGFAAAGLTQLELADHPPAGGQRRYLRAVYQRQPAG